MQNAIGIVSRVSSLYVHVALTQQQQLKKKKKKKKEALSIHVSCLAAFSRRCFLHPDPNRITTIKGGMVTKTTSPINVKHQPRPMERIIGSRTPVAPAPIRQRTKLFAAVAVAALFGYRSTSKVLTVLKEPVMPKPMTNRIVVGAARWTLYSTNQPNAITDKDPMTMSGNAISRRTLSMGKLVISVKRFLTMGKPRRRATRR